MNIKLPNLAKLSGNTEPLVEIGKVSGSHQSENPKLERLMAKVNDPKARGAILQAYSLGYNEAKGLKE